MPRNSNAGFVAFLAWSALSLPAAAVAGASATDSGSPSPEAVTTPRGAEWTILATYPIPEGASGLAYDGTHLYFGIYGSSGSNIYQIDPDTGSYSLAFAGPQEDAYGLTYDGQYLWTTDHAGSSSAPAVAMQLGWTGGLLSQFNLPAHYMSGIAYDQGNFWVARYYPDPGHLYKVNSSGTILDQFAAPDNQPWDLCVQNGNLWMADYYGNTLYKIDSASGTVLDSHASEGDDPAGIAWDGTYLWYCDDGTGYGEDMLYKVDPLGGGTPQISIPDDSHGFGPVTIGDQAIWYVTVENNGTADLEISSVTFSPPDSLDCPELFPVIVPPMDIKELAIVYEPSAYAPLDAAAALVSNDPLNPEAALTITGHGVYAGPYIHVAEEEYDFGTVRVNAHVRWNMVIQNRGSDTLTVDDILVDHTRFYLSEGAAFPASIPPLSSAQVGVWFAPDSATSFEAQLSVYSNDAGQSPLAVSCSGTGTCEPFTTGQPMWSYLIDVASDNTPKAIASIPDVNSDGIADVIVCSEDDFVRCFNGSSDGTGHVLWEHEIIAGAVYAPEALQVIEDINGDDHHDVVVGAAWGACLIRALSGKTGQSIWTHDTHEYGDGGWVYQVDCRYDYNGDGVPDVLAATGDDADGWGPKRAYCLDALTGESIWERPLSGPGFAVIGVEDFTGDEQADVVAGASNEDQVAGRAVGIDGADGSIEWSFPVSGSAVWALEQIDDITADGVRDVIVGDFSGNLYGLDATNGSVVYSDNGYDSILGFSRLDDVNGDGHADILPAYFDTLGRVISGKTGDPLWTTPLADMATVAARIADVTGDGINDVVVGTLFSNNYVYLLDGVDGAIVKAIDYGIPLDAVAAIPDIAGDGQWEIVAGGRNGRLTCFAGSDGDPCEAINPVPTASESGLMAMAAFVLAAGVLVYVRRQRQASAA